MTFAKLVPMSQDLGALSCLTRAEALQAEMQKGACHLGHLGARKHEAHDAICPKVQGDTAYRLPTPSSFQPSTS